MACRIGPAADPGAVLDPDLRVYRITGLGSPTRRRPPSSPTHTPNATVLAIAEHAAALIAGPRSPGRPPALARRAATGGRLAGHWALRQPPPGPHPGTIRDASQAGPPVPEFANKRVQFSRL